MRVLAIFFLVGIATFSNAAEWVEVSRISDNTREVDKGSIKGDKPVIAFTSRHVVADSGELKVGRNNVKYMVMEQRVDCAKRTIVVLSSEAQREDGTSISKQRLVGQDDNSVVTGSVDDDILKFVCG
ncbi:MAG: hypothetical protein KGZ83_09100 [Sulfuricella sp.]|nr:hypothetical protein [Sulfuricella sp.]